MSIEYLQKRAARITDLLEATKKIGVTPLANSDWRYAGKLALKYRKQNPNFIGPFKNKYEKFNDVLKIDNNKYNNFLSTVDKNPYTEHLVTSKANELARGNYNSVSPTRNMVSKSSWSYINSPVHDNIINVRYADTKTLLKRLGSTYSSLHNHPPDMLDVNPKTILEDFSKTPSLEGFFRANKINFRGSRSIPLWNKHTIPPVNTSYENLSKRIGNLRFKDVSTPYHEDLKGNKTFNEYDKDKGEFVRVAKDWLPSFADVGVTQLAPNRFHGIYSPRLKEIFAYKPTIDPKKTKLLHHKIPEGFVPKYDIKLPIIDTGF